MSDLEQVTGKVTGGAALGQLKAQVSAWLGGWSWHRWVGYQRRGGWMHGQASGSDRLGEKMAKQQASRGNQ